MRQQSEDVVSRVTQIVEIAAAIGVLAAVAIPAVLFPALQPAGESRGGDSAYAESGESSGVSTLSAGSQRYLIPAPKSAPSVSSEFAIAAIRRLSDRFSFARQCAIARPHVTDADVEELVQLAQLGEVAESDERSEFFALWNWLVHLEAVDLTSTQITDKALHQLTKIEGLKEVNVSGTAVTDAGIAHLAVCKELTSLLLRETKVTNQGLQTIREFKKLEILDLWKTDVGDEGMSALEDLVHLVSLTLGDTLVTDASLATIGRLESLESLDLENCAITDRGIAQIENLDQLAWLSLCNTQVGDESALRCLDCGQLRELNLTATKVTPAVLKQVVEALPDSSVTYSLE